MKKTVGSLNLILFLIIVLSSLSMQGMENGEPLMLEHSNDCFLMRLPTEVFPFVQSLEDNVKFFMRLGTTCKEFNTLLTYEKIGDYCKNYSQQVKDMTLRNLIECQCITKDYTYDYTLKRLPVLILVCAGADQAWGRNLLEAAVIKNDVCLAKIIFEHDAKINGNIRISENGSFSREDSYKIKTPFIVALDIPLLFGIKRVEMVNEFIEHGANVHAIESYEKINILWFIMDNRYPADLVAFYIKAGVDVIKKDSYREDCLLHRFADTKYVGGMRTMDNFLQKIKLILEVIPQNINLLNKRSNTPIDVAAESLKAARKCDDNVAKFAFKALIAVFREYGGSSAEELRRQEILTKLKNEGQLIGEQMSSDAYNW